MTNFYIPSKGPDSWKEFLAEPDKQWKQGYSARSLAYCWEEAEGFPESVRTVFEKSEYPLFHDIEFLLGIPEHKVWFLPMGGHPSQNDLYVLAKSYDELVSIAVEGKVDETLGPLVSDWIEEASTGKFERLEFLIELLELSNKDLSQIRYQLLHRTASALIEAERFCAPHALMMVHSFSQAHKWFEDYAAFTALFGVQAALNTVHHAGEVSGRALYFAWVVGEEVYLER